MKLFGVVAISLLLVSDVLAAEPIYSVSDYDPKRDPEIDLKKTVAMAGKDGRRILMIAGSRTCGWCRSLSREFKKEQKVADLLAKHFVIMKVNYDELNGNLFFLQDYPDIRETPHFFVLDSKGKLLRSQHSKELEGTIGYRAKAMFEFLNKWVPKKEGDGRK